MEKIQKSKGITLIALVITIIVLLILATISIATLTGENGVLTKADTAKEKAIIAEESEIIQIAYTNILTDKITEGKEITAQDLEKEINQTKTATIQEVNEIPEKAIIIDNKVSKGTICKITMDYTYYIYLNDNPMKKFYIELYDGNIENEGNLVETLAFGFEEGMDLAEWGFSEFCVGLEDWGRAESYPGGWTTRYYNLKYKGVSYETRNPLIADDDTGYVGEDKIEEGKIFKFYNK